MVFFLVIICSKRNTQSVPIINVRYIEIISKLIYAVGIDKKYLIINKTKEATQ